MNKDEYLKKLKQRLNQLNIDGKEEIMNDFTNHFELGHQDGLSDDELIHSLGSIDEILESFEGLSKQTQDDIIVDGHAHKKEFVDKIKTLNISARHADTQLSESNDGRIHVDLYKEGKLLDRLSYTLTTYQEESEYFIKVLPLFPYKNSGHYELNVQVPSNLETILLSTSSGEIEGKNIKVNQLIVQSASGDIEIEKIHSQSLKFDVASSEINLNEVYGNLEIRCVSGEIQIKDSKGSTFSYKGVSGDLTIHGDYEHINLNHVSGDIRAEFKIIQQMNGSSTSGDLNLKIGNNDNLLVNSHSVSGECDISLNNKEIHIERNGSFQVGNPNCHIKLNTISGDINLDME